MSAVAARGAEHASTLSIDRSPDNRRVSPWRRSTVQDTGGSSRPTPFFVSLEGYYLAAAAVLGRRTAELHLALADDSDPAFAPERLGPSELQAMSGAMRHHAAGVLDLLERRLRVLPEMVQPRAETLLAARSDLLARFERVRNTRAGRRPHPGSRRLPPRSDPPDRGGHRDSRLRGRAGPLARRTARQAVAPEGRRGDVTFIQLRGLRGAFRLHRALLHRLPDPGKLGR